MIRSIHLHGALADRFGSEPFRLDCNNVPMLFSGIECARPGFKAALLGLPELGIVKRTGDKVDPLTEETIMFDFGNAEELHIAAAETGSYAAAAGYIASAIAEYGTFAYFVVYAAVVIAMVYATSYVVSSLTEVASTEASQGEAVNKNGSTLFNGAVNSREQGGAVPVLYGEFIVGGTVISGEIVSERIAVALNDYIKVTTGDALTGNVLSNDVLNAVLTVVSFSVGGTTYAAGATHTDANLTLSITSAGVVSGTTSLAGTTRVTYVTADGTGLQSSATFTIEVEDPYVDYNIGGGPGGDGGGDGSSD